LAVEVRISWRSKEKTQLNKEGIKHRDSQHET